MEVVSLELRWAGAFFTGQYLWFEKKSMAKELLSWISEISFAIWYLSMKKPPRYTSKMDINK